MHRRNTECIFRSCTTSSGVLKICLGPAVFIVTGTFGGSEDHTAIMSCTAGNMHLYSYCPTKKEGVYACPPGMCFVIGVSGAIAEKTGVPTNTIFAQANCSVFVTGTLFSAWYPDLTMHRLMPLHVYSVCGFYTVHERSRMCVRSSTCYCGWFKVSSSTFLVAPQSHANGTQLQRLILKRCSPKWVGGYSAQDDTFLDNRNSSSG